VTPFDERGFVHISVAFPAAAAERMCRRLWDELARRHGVRQNDPATWTVAQPRHFQALRRSGAFEALASPVLIAALDDLLGLVERAVVASRSGDAGHSPALRKALGAAHPWLRDLWSRPTGGDRIARFMRDGAVVDGVGLRVVELVGEAGDAVVFHPWLFHAPAPNRGLEPRMVIGHNVQTASGVARYAPVAEIHET
jgi:hypothetical protein